MQFTGRDYRWSCLKAEKSGFRDLVFPLISKHLVRWDLPALGFLVILIDRDIISCVGVFILLSLTECLFLCFGGNLFLACPHPPKINNGHHIAGHASPYLPGMTVNYTCDPGYKLVGKAFIFCTHQGTWSLFDLYCKGIWYSCLIFMKYWCMRLIRLRDHFWGDHKTSINRVGEKQKKR